MNKKAAINIFLKPQAGQICFWLMNLPHRIDSNY
jgi:hypothetical protein